MQKGLSLNSICPLVSPPNPLSTYTNTEAASSAVVELLSKYIRCTDCPLCGPVHSSMPMQLMFGSLPLLSWAPFSSKS